jgi:hypothetical protein
MTTCVPCYGRLLLRSSHARWSFLTSGIEMLLLKILMNILFYLNTQKFCVWLFHNRQGNCDYFYSPRVTSPRVTSYLYFFLLQRIFELLKIYDCNNTININSQVQNKIRELLLFKGPFEANCTKHTHICHKPAECDQRITHWTSNTRFYRRLKNQIS